MREKVAATILDEIVATTRAEVARREDIVPFETLAANAAEARAGASPWRAEHRFREALARPGLSVIAEFKRRSPSAGVIRAGSLVHDIVGAYERGGASAASVLTEGPHFGGSLEDLREARASCDLPILRKDFIVERYQLHEAALAGADAVLLIVAALTDEELAALFDEAGRLQLDVLVEVHDGDELDRALALEPPTVGINNRDLRDFSVEVARTFDLLERVPEGVTIVSESGIAAGETLRALVQAGVDAVLVGESLMRAPSPESALRELRASAAGRR